MIDTLHLITEDFKVKDNHKLDIISSSKNNKVLFITEKNCAVTGIMAKYNSDIFSIDIKNYRNKSYCYIYLSIPKLLYGFNYKSVNRLEFKEAILKLKSELNDIGITIKNIASSRITRIDLFRNIDLKNEFEYYLSIFNRININKEKLMVTHEKNYVLFKNHQLAICFYDKLKELAENQNINLGINNSIARIEIRITKSVNIKTILKLSTAKDIYQNFDLLMNIYNNLLNRALSGTYYDSENTNKDNLLETLSYYKSSKKSGRYMNQFLIDKGLKTVDKKEFLLAIQVVERNSTNETIRKKKAHIIDLYKGFEILNYRDNATGLEIINTIQSSI